jgi:hypothetical protein
MGVALGVMLGTSAGKVGVGVVAGVGNAAIELPVGAGLGDPPPELPGPIRKTNELTMSTRHTPMATAARTRGRRLIRFVTATSAWGMLLIRSTSQTL